MDARKTAWDRLMTYRFEDADSDRLSMETIDALTYARDMLATQQARIEALKAAIGNINTQKEIVMKYAKESDRLMAVGRMYQAIADAAALLQEPTK